MGIKDRDSVGSQNQDAPANAEQLPVEPPAPSAPAVVAPESATVPRAATVPSGTGEVSALSLMSLSLLTAMVPATVQYVPVQEEAAQAQTEAPAVCPVCAAGTPAPVEAGFGLSALALVGFFSFFHENHKKERKEADGKA